MASKKQNKWGLNVLFMGYRWEKAIIISLSANLDPKQLEGGLQKANCIIHKKITT